MQPRAADGEQSPAERSLLMEQVIIAVRRLWFGARELPQGWATLLSEPGGDLVTLVDCDLAELEERLPTLAVKGTYAIVTDFSRPRNLGARLRRSGFRVVQRHGAYTLDVEAYRQSQADPPRPAPRRRGIFGLFSRSAAPKVTVTQIGEAELAQWNSVCWRAFGSRGSEANSLLEKGVAFVAMGAAARWYLAVVNGRPVGTAISYQAPGATQILAVGTLPAYRGRGVAEAVVRHAIEDWRQQGCGLLFLDTSPGSTAERLYQRLGFCLAYTREVYAVQR